MTLLALTSFAGEQPRIAVDKLPQNAAQVTLDCEFSTGDLKSTKGLNNISSTQAKLAGGLSNATGAFFLDDGNFFTWTGNRTAVKGTVIEDFYKRVYFTDETAYLRVVQQQYAVAAVQGWSAATTYGAGDEVLYPQPIYGDYAAGTTYKKGDIVQYPAGTPYLFRSLRNVNLAHTPNANPAWWELWGEGKRYKSLQAANLNKAPDSNPDWWTPNGVSLVGVTTRAGVPAPADWTAKKYGAGTYNVQVNASGDPTGKLDVYNVPVAVADARAAVDGSTTGVANTSALIAVARPLLRSNTVLKANDGASSNTGMAYYLADNVKQDEAVVTLYPITPGRLYTFDAPVKPNTTGEYTVLQLYLVTGVTALPATSTYFNGVRTVTLRVVNDTEIVVTAVSDAGTWGGLGLTVPQGLSDVDGVLLTNNVSTSLAELNHIKESMGSAQVALRVRGYDLTTGAVQFEVDSQNANLSNSNDNPLYRGLRLVLRDLRLGPWKGAWAAGTYAAGDRVKYTRSAVDYGFVSLIDGNTEEPLPADYNGATAYVIGNKVFENGSTWICIQAGTGHTPHTSAAYWTVYYSEKWTLNQFSAELTYGTTRLSYSFVYTLVNDWNEEGPPSDPVSIDADYGEVITLHGYIDLTDNAYQDYRKGAAGYRIRYYGFVADSQNAGEYRMVAETDELGSSSFAGAFGLQITNRPVDWNDPLATVTYDLPPPTPLAIAAGENGMLGIITKDYFAPCEPFKGWAWPVDYRKALSSRAIGLLNTPGGWLVTTQKKPRFVAGPIPEQISLAEILIEQGAISQKAMCSMGELGTAYASNDGIVIAQGLGATLASGVLFTRKEWRARYGSLLSKMRLVYHDQRLVCLFPGIAQSEASNYQGFVIRFEDGGPSYARLSLNGSGVAVDTLNDQLLIANLTGFQVFEDGDYLPLTWQSKEFLTPKPESMGVGYIEYTGGPLTVDTHADGVNKYTKNLPYAATRTEVRWRLPAGFKSQRWSLYVQESTGSPWSGGTTYGLNDCVTYGGFRWASLQAGNLNHTPSGSPTYWVQIGGVTVHRMMLATTMAELRSL